MSNQTAVEWLFKKFDVLESYTTSVSVIATKDLWLDLYQKALAMEKEQIVDAWSAGKKNPFIVQHSECCKNNGEQYYNETYHSVEPNEMIDHIGDANKMVEISDEEIEQYAKQNAFNYYEFITGAKWYREQLKGGNNES